MSLVELLKAVESAYHDVQEKAGVRADAAEALAAADKDLATAQQALTNLRAQVSDVLGNVLPQADPRFRKSS